MNEARWVEPSLRFLSWSREQLHPLREGKRDQKCFTDKASNSIIQLFDFEEAIQVFKMTFYQQKRKQSMSVFEVLLDCIQFGVYISISVFKL